MRHQVDALNCHEVLRLSVFHGRLLELQTLRQFIDFTPVRLFTPPETNQISNMQNQS